MTMHEINAAAEVITAAADPEANIIFGATINPELEGEIIITVVATGFEATYYANRQHVRSNLTDEGKKEGSKPKAHEDEDTVAELLKNASDTDESKLSDDPIREEDIKELDMELEDKKPKEDPSDLKDEAPLPNIWSFDADESDKEEDKFDKPSFLRRLKRRKKNDE